MPNIEPEIVNLVAEKHHPLYNYYKIYCPQTCTIYYGLNKCHPFKIKMILKGQKLFIIIVL